MSNTLLKHLQKPPLLGAKIQHLREDKNSLFFPPKGGVWLGISLQATITRQLEDGERDLIS